MPSDWQNTQPQKSEKELQRESDQARRLERQHQRDAERETEQQGDSGGPETDRPHRRA